MCEGFSVIFRGIKKSVTHANGRTPPPHLGAAVSTIAETIQAQKNLISPSRYPIYNGAGCYGHVETIVKQSFDETGTRN